MAAGEIFHPLYCLASAGASFLLTATILLAGACTADISILSAQRISPSQNAASQRIASSLLDLITPFDTWTADLTCKSPHATYVWPHAA